MNIKIMVPQDVQSGTWVPTFRRNFLLPSSEQKKIETAISSESLLSISQVTWHRTLDDRKIKIL
jgi:hypothetical protein